MGVLEVTVSCAVVRSFRVEQVAGMFDVPLGAKASECFRVQSPRLDEPWQIGLIVGPSGSGKSTLARRLFAHALYAGDPWPTDRAVVDGFGERPLKEIAAMLTAVGFSSPPSWIKPYQVLSNGERFRCDLARALLAPADVENPLVAFDEFTSVVDRNVARIGSAAVSKAIRQGSIGCRFVAITCHYDVTEWLAPDWVLDMASGEFSRRRLRRPAIELALFRCSREAWGPFARHHYLSGTVSPHAVCYLALWQGVPVAFCAVLPLVGRKGRRRISRIVTLPDYQGVGIGAAVLEAVAGLERRAGHRVNITASHPAIIAHCRRSPRWRTVQVRKRGGSPRDHFLPGYKNSAGRAVVSFEYTGGGMSNDESQMSKE